jgi:ferredoxin
MRQKIAAMETPVTMIDLSDDPDVDFIIPQLFDAKDNICLYIGSPVYAAHPIPPIMAFIARMPQAENGFSVPFVTWGAVTSGIALYEMGAALAQKGYPVLGAAKVLARHSMMWAADTPLGAGHPNAEDDRMIEALLQAVADKLKKTDSPTLAPSVLDYQAQPLRDQMAQSSFEQAKSRFPQKKVLIERCTQCGVCVENCPVEAIQVTDAPEIGPVCIHCLNCVRLCPESAIVADLPPVYERLHALAEKIKERPCTQIYI